ncbi:MAG: DUF1684 domain-containing protein [Formosa sp.]|jgi:uncharacterized protein|nr:DUF1684 domain-containing protein [Formosa sp.]|tara:strand:- start:122 stop:1009 length:888 start_codon:yes stop_codon:yes gene_type:complete
MVNKHILIIGLILLFYGCNDSKKNQPLSLEYLSSLSQNIQERAEKRVKYLELTGLFKLDSAANTFGKNPSNKFVLDIEYLPSSLGSISLFKNKVKFNSLEKSLIYDSVGNQIDSLALYIDSNGNSIELYYKFLKWQVITRSGALYLRLWDAKNPAIKAFKGFNSYEAKSEFIIEGDFKYYKSKHTESVSSKLGINDNTDFIGKVEFAYNDKSYTLDVGSQGFTMVGDLTSGESTYGGGRYLYLDLPKTDGKISLDFNYLYNPPCAFSEFTTCLFPPQQNQLPIEIKAGERIDKAL